jgi:polysaccharide export outer membrane protein
MEHLVMTTDKTVKPNTGMVARHRMCVVYIAALLALGPWSVAPVLSQSDYLVGPQDALAIAVSGEPSLTGRFAVETDGTFIYPHIGRVRAGGVTVGEVATAIRSRLKAGGFSDDPEVTVTVAQNRSRKIFVVGAVRSPGEYSLSHDMRLSRALALAGSTLPAAAGEVVIVSAGSEGMVITSSAAIDGASPEARNADAAGVTRVNVGQRGNDVFAQNVALKDGDTVFVLRAENIYLSGQVKNPGAYWLQRDNTTVSQGLALAGGVTDRGATSHVEIVRSVGGERKMMTVGLDAPLLPGDAIVVPERLF